MNNPTDSIQFLVFLTLLGIGFVYIVLSALLNAVMGLGDDVGGDGEVSAEHSDDTVSIFSPKIVAIFMVGFGGAGAIASAYGMGVLGSIIWGFITGGGFGALGLAGFKWLASQRATSCVHTSSAVGKVANVSIPIQAGGQGQVSLTLDGQHMTYTARAVSPTTVYSVGAPVVVTAIEGTILLVN